MSKAGETLIQSHSLLQERVYSRKLSNGCQLFVWPKPGFTKKFAVFSTYYGSIDSHFIPPGQSEVVHVPDGIAHFLEHKMFEEEDGSVFDRFSRLGASANAYTNYTNTTYLFSCTDHFEENLKILIDFVLHPYFTDENVEKEKGIIAQELQMYRDIPEQRVYRNLLEALYHVNPVRLEIGGTVESIQKITKELLYTCYNTFYHPSNMVLVAVGDIDPEATLDLAEREIMARRPSFQGEIRRVYPEEPEGVNEKRREERLAAARPIFYLGFKDPATGKSGEELVGRELAMDFLLHLLFGPSSDLYTQLYEEGLINDEFGSMYSAAPSYAYAIVGGETPDPGRLEARLWEGIEKQRREGISAEDLERVRRRFLGQTCIRFDSVEFIANAFSSLYFRGVNLLTYIDLIHEVKQEQVAELLQTVLTPERAAVSIVWPSGNGTSGSGA
ncbi:MAG: insulinase family protein [Limnochordales bacterium]|nr:insulinase family protein [Limnochordales bacterium]